MREKERKERKVQFSLDNVDSSLVEFINYTRYLRGKMIYWKKATKDKLLQKSRKEIL